MMAINPKTATERINYPSRELVGTETKEAFDAFVSCLDSVELREPMRRTIVEWRLLGREPYRAFFYLSRLIEEKYMDDLLKQFLAEGEKLMENRPLDFFESYMSPETQTASGVPIVWFIA